MSKDQKIAIIVPAYNEATVIKTVIKQLNEVLSKTPYHYQIVVVDDGSRDDTAAAARSARAYVIRHILNTGHGGAAATGISYARQNGFEMAAMLDGDGQHDPKDLLKSIELCLKSKADLVIGSRLIKAAGMSKVKIIGNRALSFITYLLFGVYVTDSQSGMRVFSKRALDNLKWKSRGYEFCSEMVWRAKQRNLKIVEYPIKAIYTPYSESKGQNNWNGFNIVKFLFKSRFMELFGE